MSQNKIPFEIVKIENKKAPLFLEVPVPPHCVPILVGGSKNSTLKWADRATAKQTILTWSVDSSIEDISKLCLQYIYDRAMQDEWDCFALSEEEAIKKVKSHGIEKVKRIDNMIVSQEPDLLGTIIIFENKFYPVIHNSIRAICFIEGSK